MRGEGWMKPFIYRLVFVAVWVTNAVRFTDLLLTKVFI
jgi:hypothetical protein